MELLAAIPLPKVKVCFDVEVHLGVDSFILKCLLIY